MEIKLDDKDLARKGIIRAAKSYSKHLSGKVFLYVFGNEYIEVMFRADDFLHMTETCAAHAPRFSHGVSGA